MQINNSMTTEKISIQFEELNTLNLHKLLKGKLNQWRIVNSSNHM